MRIHENELLTFKVSTSVRHLLTSFLSSSTFVAKDSICAVITNTDNHFKTRKKEKKTDTGKWLKWYLIFTVLILFQHIVINKKYRIGLRSGILDSSLQILNSSGHLNKLYQRNISMYVALKLCIVKEITFMLETKYNRHIEKTLPHDEKHNIFYVK